MLQYAYYERMGKKMKEIFETIENNHERDTAKGLNLESIKQYIKMNSAKTIIVSACICASIAYAYFFVGVMTTMEIKNILSEGLTTNNTFDIFGDLYIRYGQDGMALLDNNANEIWNISYQISNPIIDTQGDTLVLADRNGNQIIVAQEDGIKGEIFTGLPIEKVSVSSQGIVVAMLKSADGSDIICYDSVGNIIAEHKASTSGVGYPLDVAISNNGNKMMITYIQYMDGMIESTYRCYSLTDPEETNYEKMLVEGTVESSILATCFFMGNDTAVLLADDRVMVVDTAKAGSTPEEYRINGEITQVLHNDKYIVIPTKLSEEKINELNVYDSKGRLKTTVEFQGNYTDMKLIDNKVVMTEGTRSKIYSISGKEIFEGEYTMDILGVYPTSGINKYIVIDKEKIVKVQLKR